MIGLAFSGGGIPAALSTMCILDSLFTHIPDFSVNSIVSTTSGGSVGYLLYEQMNGTTTFPHYDPNVTFATIDGKMRTPHHHWFANLVSVIPPDGPWAERVLNAFMSVAKNYDEWFSKTLHLLDRLLYGKELVRTPAHRQWYSSVALMARSHLPIELDNMTGVYSGAAEGLSLAVVELDSFPKHHHVNMSGPLALGTSRIANYKSMTVWDEVAHSVFFWGTDVISDPAKFAAQETALPFGHLLPSRTKVSFLDGGLVDPTGMAALLQHQVESIVLFYNVNHPLTMVDAGLAWLWGRDSKAPGNIKHACLHGPRLGKVFANPDVYDEVYSNLTDPEIMRARLTDVDVQTNEFLGIRQYKLKDLLIVSNEFSPGFVGSFQDPLIRETPSDKFPNNYKLAVSKAEANLMCMFNDWKVQRHIQELTEMVVAASDKGTSDEGTSDEGTSDKGTPVHRHFLGRRVP